MRLIDEAVAADDTAYDEVEGGLDFGLDLDDLDDDDEDDDDP